MSYFNKVVCNARQKLKIDHCLIYFFTSYFGTVCHNLYQKCCMIVCPDQCNCMCWDTLLKQQLKCVMMHTMIIWFNWTKICYVMSLWMLVAKMSSHKLIAANHNYWQHFVFISKIVVCGVIAVIIAKKQRKKKNAVKMKNLQMCKRLYCWLVGVTNMITCTIYWKY